MKKVLSIVIVFLMLSSLMIPTVARDSFLGGAGIAIKLEWDKKSYVPGDTAYLNIYMDADDNLSLHSGRLIIGLNSDVIKQEDNSNESLRSQTIVSDTYKSYWKNPATEGTGVNWAVAESAINGLKGNNTQNENNLYDQYLVVAFFKNVNGTHPNASSSEMGILGAEINPEEPLLRIPLKITKDNYSANSLNAAITSGALVRIQNRPYDREPVYFLYYSNSGNSSATEATSVNISQAKTIAQINDLPCYPSGYDFDFDRYWFQNLDETISEDIYKKAYGNVKGSWLYFLYEDGDTHGHCYGMSSTTAALLKHQNAISKYKMSIDGEDYYVSNMNGIYPESISDLFDTDARTYIKYGYVYQFDSDVQKAEKASQNNVSGLYDAVERYVNGTGEPVIINVYHKNLLGRKDGHSVFAVGILEENAKKYILINDSNIPYEVQKMEVNTDASTWEYNVDVDGVNIYNYSSENGLFTYSFPADVVYNIGLLLNSNYSEILSSNNKLVSSTNAVSSNCNLEEIMPVTSGTDESTESTKLYWVEKSAEDVEITAQEDNSTITVADNNSSVSVEINSTESANFVVDDDVNNSVVVDSADGEAVDVTFTTANCYGDEVEIVVSGTSNSDEVSASLTDNGISISGVSDGDVSVVKYDEIVETKNITDTENEINFETKIPESGHNYIDGVCTECGEKTIVIDEMTSQIRFDKNYDKSYAGTFDVRTRAIIYDDAFKEVIGATNDEATENIDKIGFVYTLDGENFSATSAQAVAQGETVSGYVDAPVSYIQDADGYYMFTCLVTDIPDTDKDYTLTAYAYICVNGKWYFSEVPMNADFNSLYTTYYPVACEKYGWEV